MNRHFHRFPKLVHLRTLFHSLIIFSNRSLHLISLLAINVARIDGRESTYIPGSQPGHGGNHLPIFPRPFY